MASDQLTWEIEKKQLIAEAFGKFAGLGFWTNKNTIDYRDSKPAFQVSPRYLLERIFDQLSMQKLTIIQSVVQTCQNLQRLGFSSEYICRMFSSYEKRLGNESEFKFQEYSSEVNSISYLAKDIGDFEKRLKKLELSRKLHREALELRAEPKYMQSACNTFDKFL